MNEGMDERQNEKTMDLTSNFNLILCFQTDMSANVLSRVENILLTPIQVNSNLHLENLRQKCYNSSLSYDHSA